MCYRRLQIQGRGGTLMTSESANLPAAVDRAAFQAELDALRVREKAHTREGDAIAAARRRLPMVGGGRCHTAHWRTWGGDHYWMCLRDAGCSSPTTSCGTPATLRRSSARVAPG